MRQKAVSSAPQKLAPTQTRRDEGDDARGGGGLADLAQRVAQRRVRRGGEELLEVGEDRALELRAGEHLAGDEQRDQRDREDAQEEVVGDHRGEAGQVVRVGLLPEPVEPGSDPPHRLQHGGQGSRCRAGLGGYRSGGTPIPPSKERPKTHGPTHLPPPAAGRRRRRSSRRVRQARSGQAAPPGWRVQHARALLAARARAVELRRAGAARQHRPRRCPRPRRWSRPSRGAASRSRSRRCRRTTPRP